MEVIKMIANHEYQEISIELLVPFENHLFKAYEGQRFKDMVESIRTNGVHTPIIVRPAADNKYEILSGHNRVAAAKEAEHTTIPAIIREGLNDKEALLIVTETNLIQRSFADMSHSERAIVLATHYEAIKKQSGYRTDLVSEIQEMISPDVKKKPDNQTCAPLGRRSDSRELLAEQYCLSKNTIARYWRINKLIPELMGRLDTGGIGMRVAEALAYLGEREQKIVNQLLDKGCNINISKAEKLKRAYKKTGAILDPDINRMLETKPSTEKKNKKKEFTSEVLTKYFSSEQSAEEIIEIMREALSQFMSKK